MLQETTEMPSTTMNGVDVAAPGETLPRNGYSRVRVKMSVEGASPAEALETLAKFFPVRDIVSNSLPVEVSAPRHRNIASSGAAKGSDVPVHDIEPNSLPADILAARQRYLAASGCLTNNAGTASQLDREHVAPGHSPVHDIVSNSLTVELSV
jgi:hypothetical protein